MFRDVPGCSGMFHVPGFIDRPLMLKLRVKIAVPTVLKLATRRRTNPTNLGAGLRSNSTR